MRVFFVCVLCICSLSGCSAKYQAWERVAVEREVTRRIEAASCAVDYSALSSEQIAILQLGKANERLYKLLSGDKGRSHVPESDVVVGIRAIADGAKGLLSTPAATGLSILYGGSVIADKTKAVSIDRSTTTAITTTEINGE